jgi:hypothetical protein
MASAQESSVLEDLAWQIWSSGRPSVPVEDHNFHSALGPFLQTGLLREDSEGLAFSDDSAMVAAAARHFVSLNYKSLTEDPMQCFELLHDVWRREIGKRETVSGHVLAVLHNRGRVDAFSWGRQAIEAGCNVFSVLRIFETAVPVFSDASPASLLSFFAGHHEKVKNDLAGGRVFPALDKWFASHPILADEVKGLYLREPQEAYAAVFRSALQGLVLNDFHSGFPLIMRTAESEQPLVREPALMALGLIDFEKKSRSRALSKAVNLCRRIVEEGLPSSLPGAVRTLGRLVAYDETVVDLLAEAGIGGDPPTLYALSYFLFTNADTYGEKGWYERLLRPLAATKFEHKGTLSNIDMILMKRIYSDRHQQNVIEFIDTWLSSQPGQLDNQALSTAFPDVLSELVKDPRLLSRLLTSWLLTEDHRFPLSVYGLIAHLGASDKQSIHLDATALDDLTHSELRFLARRILGYLAGDEILIPLVFSMVCTKDAANRTFGLIAEVLTNHIGYDYPYQTIEYLKSQQSIQEHGEDVRRLCEEIVTQLESRMETLHGLPDTKELQPSFIKAQRFAKERARQFNEAVEEAEKHSILSLIVTRISLKAGRRSFQALDDHYTDPMELKPFSQSVAIPRSEVTDPAGAARARALFRKAKRDDA